METAGTCYTDSMKKRVKRVLIGIVLLACTVLGLWYLIPSYPEVPTYGRKEESYYLTSKAYRYEQDIFEAAKEEYPVTSVLSEKRTIPIPGLEKTHLRMTDRKGKLYDELCSCMIPQGLCVTEKYILVSAYCENTTYYNHPSVLYVLDKKTGDYLTTISLYTYNGTVVSEYNGNSFSGQKPLVNHVGGLAYGKEKVWIALGSDRQVGSISIYRINQAVRMDRDGVALSLDHTLDCKYTASYLTWYQDQLWIGNYEYATNGSLHAFHVNELGNSIQLKEAEDMFVLPSNANGAAFTKINGRDCLAVSCSKSRNFLNREYDHKIYLYEVRMDGSASDAMAMHDYYTVPPMAENVVIDGQDIYMIFESGARKYSGSDTPEDNAEHVVDRICVGNAADFFYWTNPDFDDSVAKEMTDVSDKEDTINQDEKKAPPYIKARYTGIDSYGTHRFAYSDSFWIKSSVSRQPDREMMDMSVSLSASSYHKAQILDVYQQIGFTTVDVYNYQRQATYQDPDFVAYTVASKDVEINGERVRVYVVAIRGSMENDEWFSNFNLGENGQHHDGYYKATKEIYNTLMQEYFEKDGLDAVHRKILITGHNRGAAIANYLAGQLTDDSMDQGMIVYENIYAYTFGCPNVSRNAGLSYQNIFNINYEGDWYCLFPLSEWAYYRYGKTITIQANEDFYTTFKEISGVDYTGTETVDTYKEKLMDYIPSEQAYHEHRASFVMLAYYLSGQDPNIPVEKMLKDLNLNVQENEPIDSLPEYLESLQNETKYTTTKKQLKRIIKKTADYDEDEWKGWKTNNQPFIAQVKELTGISIKKRSNLQKALDDVTAKEKKVQSLQKLSDDFFVNYLDSNQKLNEALYQSDCIETYLTCVIDYKNQGNLRISS